MIIEPGNDNVHENVFNQVVGYLNGEGIMTDESGMVAAAYLSVLGNYEPDDSWHLNMLLCVKKAVFLAYHQIYLFYSYQ